MLIYVAPDQLSPKDLLLLSNALSAAPVWPDAGEIMQKIHAGDSKAFRFPGGLMLLEAHQFTNSRRLLITAFAGSVAIWKRLDLAGDLRRIATEWLCDTIETTVFDPRLAGAITRIGGKVESQTLTLSVEG